MSLGIGLLQQRKPRLVRVLALGKVQSAAVGLVRPPVDLLRVWAVDVFPQDAFDVDGPAIVGVVVVGFDQVQLSGVSK